MSDTITVPCDGLVDAEGIGRCQNPVSYIDAKGYAYCTHHGRERQASQRCRKLRPAELKRLQAGEQLERY